MSKRKRRARRRKLALAVKLLAVDLAVLGAGLAWVLVVTDNPRYRWGFGVLWVLIGAPMAYWWTKERLA